MSLFLFDYMKENIKSIIPYIGVILIVLFIKQFIVSPILVRGDSMDSTLKDGDFMILDKLKYRFKDINRFDIVVVKTSKSYIIKRVIALPGETIEYKDNKLYINGEYIEEDFLKEGVYTKDYKFERALNDDEYFVLGDNRMVSKDSRIIGPVTKKDIDGKALFTLFPFTRFGVKK